MTMTITIRETLESLEVSVPKLNQMTNDINVVVKRVEDYLNDQLRVGMSCRTHFWTENIEPTEEHDSHHQLKKYLSYARFKGNYFRIAVEERIIVNGKDSLLGKIGWSEVPREIKLAAFPYLPFMLTQLAAKIEGVMAASQEAEKILEKLEGFGTVKV